MPLLSHFLCFLSLSLFTNLEGLAQIPSSLWKLFLIFSPHIPWKIRQNDSLPFTFPCFHGTKMLLCFITSCYTLLLINQFPSLSVSCLRKPVTRECCIHQHSKKILTFLKQFSLALKSSNGYNVYSFIHLECCPW